MNMATYLSGDIAVTEFVSISLNALANCAASLAFLLAGLSRPSNNV